MTNAFYVALTFKLRTLGSAERAAATKADEDSPWEHLGVEREDLDKAVGQVAGSADVEMLLPFAQRLWNEPVWEFKVAALKTLALDHVSTTPELWKFVLSAARQVDGPRLAYNLALVAQKSLLDFPSRLADVAGWVESRNKWMRCLAVLSVMRWAEEGHDVAEILPWMAALATDPEDCIQDALGHWLRAYGAHEPTGRNAFLAEHGEKMSSAARAEAGR